MTEEERLLRERVRREVRSLRALFGENRVNAAYARVLLESYDVNQREIGEVMATTLGLQRESR